MPGGGGNAGGGVNAGGRGVNAVIMPIHFIRVNILRGGGGGG